MKRNKKTVQNKTLSKEKSRQSFGKNISQFLAVGVYIIPALFIFRSIFFCFFGSISVSSGCANIQGARI